MVICLMPVMAFAADEATATGISQFSDADSIKNENKQAVAVLVGLGIIDGMGDGTFQPKGDLTRAQSSKLVATLVKSGDKSDIPAPAANPFTDVQKSHWASGAIKFGVDNGYINGMGDGTFHPDDQVTTAQLATMLCKLLGFSVEDINYHWPENAMAKANEEGLLIDVNKSADEVLNREEAAQMIFNALKADMRVKTTTTGSDNDLVDGGSTYDRVKNKYSQDYRSKGGDAVQQLIEKYFPTVTYVTDEPVDDFGRPSTVWKDGKTKITEDIIKEPVLVYTSQEKSSDVSTEASDQLYDDLNGYGANLADIIVNGDFDRNVTVDKNDPSALKDSDALADVIAGYTGNGVSVELYANEKETLIETVVVADYELDEVAKVNAKKQTIKLVNNNSKDITKKDSFYAGISSVAAEDFVMVAVNNNNEIIDAYLPKPVEGVAVTRLDNPTKNWLEDAKATIGGEVYYYNTHGVGGDGLRVDPSDLGTIYLDEYGYLVAYSKEKKDAADWALLESIYYVTEYNEVGEALVNWYAIMVEEDGTVANVPLMYITDEDDPNYRAARPTVALADDFMTNVENNVRQGAKGYAQIGNNWFALNGDLVTYVEAAAGYKLANSDPNNLSWKTENSQDKINSKSTKVDGYYFSDPLSIITVSGKKASKLKASVASSIEKTYNPGTYKYVRKIDGNNTLVTSVFITGQASDITIMKLTKILGRDLES